MADDMENRDDQLFPQREGDKPGHAESRSARGPGGHGERRGKGTRRVDGIRVGEEEQPPVGLGELMAGQFLPVHPSGSAAPASSRCRGRPP